MASRNHGLSIDFKCFEDFAAELDNLGADLQKIFTDVLEQEGETVAEDTKEAVQAAYLPAKGKYSSSAKETENSIVTHPKVEWSGSIGEIGLGFDKTKRGAGGFLITGTPKMRPDYELEKIFVRKMYQKKMTKSIMDYLQAEIDDHLKRFK